MTVTCLAFSGVIAEDGLDTQGLSVGPTAPIAGAWSWGHSGRWSVLSISMPAAVSWLRTVSMRGARLVTGGLLS